MTSFDAREIDAVLDLLQKVSLPPGEPLPPGASDIQIARCESRIAIRFPDCFRKWLSTCNGPCVGAGGLVGIEKARQTQDVESILGSYPMWAVRGWLPIAGDGFGNYFIMPTFQEYGLGFPIAFVDNHVDVEKPAYIAASNCLRFLQFFLSKELRQSSWPFNKQEVLERDPEITSFHNILFPWQNEDATEE